MDRDPEENQVKATNEELREALEACVTVIDEYKPALYGEAWHGLFRAAHNARALLDGKSCEDCEFGDSNDVNLLCIWKRSHGPVWDRNCIPCALSRDYADECPEYKEKHK